MAQLAFHPSASRVRARCPECNGQLTVLRVIPGRGGAEYWAMQCDTCHGVHLDIVEPPTMH
jgi:Zn finger protein HypA/HybF involved in hydrogenase expression